MFALRGRLLGSHPVFDGVRVAYRFSFLCCVFVLFVFVLSFVYPLLTYSLNCPFLIAPSVFSNVYVLHILLDNYFCCLI